MTAQQRPSNSQRREQARLKAQQQRRLQRRRHRRDRLVLQASVGVALIAVLTVIASVLATTPRTVGSAPQNMADGSITISGAALRAIRTSAVATPSAAPDSQFKGKVLIQEWEDFGCPACRRFEQTNATEIQQLVASGAAVVQYYPVAILDTRFTAGDDYSSRAANAAAAVANWSPDTFRAFHAALYRADVQPAEGGSGLTDDRLLQIAQQAGASHMTQIRRAVHDHRFASWVAARTDDFTHDRGPLAAVDFPAGWGGPSTPTILVNGHYYDGTTDFGAFVTATAGTSE